MAELTKEKLEGKNWNEIQKMAKGLDISGKRNRKNLVTAILESGKGKKEKDVKKETDVKTGKRSKYEHMFLECAKSGPMLKDGSKIQELEKEILTKKWYIYPHLRAGFWNIKTPGYFPEKTTMRKALNGKTWAKAKKEVMLFGGRGNILTFSTEKLVPVEEGEQDSKGNHFLLIIPAEGQELKITTVDGKKLEITRDNYLDHYQHFSNHGRCYKVARILASTYKLKYVALPRGADNGYNKSNSNNLNYFYHCFGETWKKYDKRGDEIEINGNPLYDIINHVEEEL